MKKNRDFTQRKQRLLIIALLLNVVACSKEPVSEASVIASPSFAYVTSQDAGVSKIDLSIFTVVQQIDVKAEGPRGIAITEDGKKLVVATRENESISVIDASTGEVLQQIKVGKNPEFVRIKGDFAYISSEPSAVGGPPPKPGSSEEDDDDDEEKIPATIAVVDLVKGEKVREITGGPETEGIEFSADGTQLVITNEADNTITVHNIADGELVKTIHTHEYGDRPRGIKVSPDGNTYLATLEYGNKFLVLDKSFNVIRTVDTAETPYGISYDTSGERIFVAANKAKVLEVFDAKTYEKIKEIPTGNRCWHFTFTPDDKNILLACGKSDAIYVIDAEKLEVTNQISVKDMPWGLVTFPKSMGSLDSKF
jgi:YVTN family beta-propeller protein